MSDHEDNIAYVKVAGDYLAAVIQGNDKAKPEDRRDKLRACELILKAGELLGGIQTAKPPLYIVEDLKE